MEITSPRSEFQRQTGFHSTVVIWYLTSLDEFQDIDLEVDNSCVADDFELELFTTPVRCIRHRTISVLPAV
jgi:hypothetical protein